MDEYKTGLSIGLRAVFDPTTTPAAAADKGFLYFKTSGSWYVRTPTGGERKLLDSTDLTTINAALDAHLAQATGAHAASAVSYTAGGTVAGTNVQTALAEVASEANTRLTALEADVAALLSVSTGTIVAINPHSLNFGQLRKIDFYNFTMFFARFTYGGGNITANDEGGIADIDFGTIPTGFRPTGSQFPVYAFTSDNGGGGGVSSAGVITLRHIESTGELSTNDTVTFAGVFPTSIA